MFRNLKEDDVPNKRSKVFDWVIMDTAWYAQSRMHHVVLGDNFIIAVG